MKRNITLFLMISVLLIISFIFLTPAQTGLNNLANTTKNQGTTKIIGFIYNDVTIGNSYKAELEKFGWSVELINESNLDTGNWSSYSLIILGSDTGSIYTWGNSTAVPYLNNFGVPFLATGSGALSFYSELGLADSWGSNAGGVGYEIFAYNLTNPGSFFTTPYNIDLNATIMNTNMSWQGYYIGGGVDPTVLPIAVDISQTNYTTIAVQSTRYGDWGYDGTPSDWTTQGEYLFENLVTYLVGSPPPVTTTTSVISYSNSTSTTQSSSSSSISLNTTATSGASSTLNSGTVSSTNTISSSNSNSTFASNTNSTTSSKLGTLSISAPGYTMLPIILMFPTLIVVRRIKRN